MWLAQEWLKRPRDINWRENQLISSLDCMVYNCVNDKNVTLRILHSIFYHGAKGTVGPRPSHYRGFMITLRHTTLCRTSLEK